MTLKTNTSSTGMGRKECFYLVLILKAISFINCSYSPDEIQKQPSTGAHQNRFSKNLLNSQENTCPGFSFSIKLQAYIY